LFPFVNWSDEALVDEAGADEQIYADLNNLTGPTKESLMKTNVRKEIIRQFEAFLRTYKEESEEDKNNQQIEPIYMDKILEIGRDNKSSLVVDYTHLSNKIGKIAILAADEPEIMFEVLNEAAYNLVKGMYPNYHNITKEINVRITNLPIVDSLRDLRQAHLNSLVKVEGVVTRRTGVFPQLKIVHYNCVKCSTVIGPYTQQSNKEIAVGVCPECQSKGKIITINSPIFTKISSTS
jgi:DNA replication licensing factor MCM2